MSCALVTCSGISNTGRLTTQAAQILLQRKPGQYVWIHTRQSAAMLDAELGDAEKVIVIEGCMDRCASRKLKAAGHEADYHIIATELGIEKKGMRDVQFDEIEKIIGAILNEGSVVEHPGSGKSLACDKELSGLFTSGISSTR